jgi:hypothetical protein
MTLKWSNVARAASSAPLRRLAAGGALVVVAACGSILDVDNPNNADEAILTDPTAATNFVNGVGNTVTRALAGIITPYGAATDELTWVGSRDAYLQLDLGDISEVSNEFVDGANAYVNEARWLADEAIESLLDFEARDVLEDPNDLARAYLFAAVMYITIPDMFDDFTISDGAEAGPPIGEANMSQMYDTAIEYLTEAQTRVTDATLRGRILALRARAHYSKGVWATVNPVVPAAVGTNAVLVNSAAASADAAAALATGTGLGASDWRWDLTPTELNLPLITYGNEINDRLELRFGSQYVNPTAAGNRTASTKLLDPIDNIVDPALDRYVSQYSWNLPTNTLEGANLVPMTIVSAREMHLILAEAALQAADLVTFQTRINAVRAYDNLTPWTPASTVTAYNILKHERRVNLFMQGRRLADHYRFGENADLWTATSFAVQTRGCFFPITATERAANDLARNAPLACN